MVVDQDSDIQEAVAAICGSWACGLALLGFIRLCNYCCCRKKHNAEADSDVRVCVDATERQVKSEHLTQRKQCSTAYLLWLTAGTFGAHHFYLGRLAHGFFALVTFNFFFFGWFLDFYLLPGYICFANRDTADISRDDGSAGRLWRYWPLVVPFLVTFWLGVVPIMGSVPRGLQNQGYVDIDSHAAGTKSNPYELLGIEKALVDHKGRSSNHKKRDASAAFQREKLKLDRTCPSGKECKDKMAQLKKAYEFVKKKCERNKKEDGITDVTDHEAYLDDWKIFLEILWKKVYSWFEGKESDKAAEEEL